MLARTSMLVGFYVHMNMNVNTKRLKLNISELIFIWSISGYIWVMIVGDHDTRTQTRYNKYHTITGVITVGNQIFVTHACATGSRIRAGLSFRADCIMQTTGTFTSKYLKHYDGLSSQKKVLIEWRQGIRNSDDI